MLRQCEPQSLVRRMFKDDLWYVYTRSIRELRSQKQWSFTKQCVNLPGIHIIAHLLCSASLSLPILIPVSLSWRVWDDSWWVHRQDTCFVHLCSTTDAYMLSRWRPWYIFVHNVICNKTIGLNPNLNVQFPHASLCSLHQHLLVIMQPYTFSLVCHVVFLLKDSACAI